MHDVHPLVCPRCPGEMGIVAFIIDHQVIDKVARYLRAKGDHTERGPAGWADLEVVT